MTDSQTLLAEYAKTGSEDAFRELVKGYIGLVYSSALRLVHGDTHLAQDVTQLVFIDHQLSSSRGLFYLCVAKNLLNDAAGLVVGNVLLLAVEEISQFSMIEAEEVQQGGMVMIRTYRIIT